ncbi:MAG: DUF2497 domain-containing protein [Azospirillaceae bacterium]
MAAQQDQSVDEILASIRRIIAEDTPARPAAPSGQSEPQVELDPLDDDEDEPLVLSELAPSDGESSHRQAHEGTIRFARAAGGETANGHHDVLLLTDPLDPPPATRTSRAPPAEPGRPRPHTEGAPRSTASATESPVASSTAPAGTAPTAGASSHQAGPGPAAPSPDLVSAATRQAVSRAFGDLLAEASTHGARGGRPEVGEDESLEDLVRGALRPVLRQWLDQHLPQIVRSIVEREIARLSSPSS